MSNILSIVILQLWHSG